MTPLNALREKARRIAMGENGVHEVGGNNLGPRVQQYLAACGLPPGQAWCVAFVVWSYQQAARAVLVRSPLPRIGHAGKFFRHVKASHPHWVSGIPTLGAIACRQTDPTDPDSPGHMGIITAIDEDSLTDISGNTNSAGSRAGNLVGLNDRLLGYWNLGFIDVGRLGPVVLPSAA